MVCRAIKVVLVLFLLFLASPAAAQDVVMAHVYFESGLKAMDEGNFDVACPDLAKSQQLDPNAGTLFAWADCERQRGRIATAAALFEDYLRQVEALPPDKRSKHAERMKLAQDYQTGLREDIPTLLIELPPEAPSGVRVFRDGVELNAALLGVASPMDPGDHAVQVEMGDAKLPEQRVRLDKGERKRWVVVLPRVTTRQTEGPKPLDVVKKPEAASWVVTLPSPAKREQSSSMSMRTGGFVALGAGAVGIVAGSILGGMAIEKKTVYDKGCPDEFCNGKTEHEALVQGKTLAHGSTAAFAVGIAGLATGTVLLVLARRDTQKRSAKPWMQMMAGPGSMDVLFGMQGAF